MKNRFCRIARSALALLACLPSAAAQLTSFPKQDLVDYTAKSPFERLPPFEDHRPQRERLPDGRPKVPDELIERARGLSSEEVWAVLQDKEFNNQYADGFQVLHPGKTMVGRAFTVQFMPLRADVDDVAQAKAKERGVKRLMNQTAIDMLQPGDVLVVDLFGKKVNGTIVGDNLFFYVNQATHGGGLVVDGSIRDLNGISEIDMPAYFRFVDPTPIGNVMLTGINVPVRIQGVTVMPGDLVVGDREGVYFIPPQFVQEVLDKAAERKAALAYEREQRRRGLERAKEEAARQKERERRQQAVDKAQAALDKAEQEHAKRAAAIQAELEALEKRSQAEKARWDKEKERLGAALQRARG